MKTKTKIIAIIASFCFIVAFGVFSAFALKDITHNIGGSLDFQLAGVAVQISDGTLVGAELENEDKDERMKGFSTTSSMTEDELALLTGYQSWSDLEILITEETGVATLSFTIKNTAKNPDAIVGVSISVEGSDEEVEITTSGNKNIAQNATETFTITFTVQDPEVVLSEHEFAIHLNIGRTEVEVPSLSISQITIGETELELPSTSFVNDATFNLEDNSPAEEETIIALTLANTFQDSFRLRVEHKQIDGLFIVYYTSGISANTTETIVIILQNTTQEELSISDCDIVLIFEKVENKSFDGIALHSVHTWQGNESGADFPLEYVGKYIGSQQLNTTLAFDYDQFDITAGLTHLEFVFTNSYDYDVLIKINSTNASKLTYFDAVIPANTTIYMPSILQIIFHGEDNCERPISEYGISMTFERVENKQGLVLYSVGIGGCDIQDLNTIHEAGSTLAIESGYVCEAMRTMVYLGLDNNSENEIRVTLDWSSGDLSGLSVEFSEIVILPGEGGIVEIQLICEGDCIPTVSDYNLVVTFTAV